jgi:ATP-utilising chromatin assembly and remodelling N-terminal/Williams-Beuren syndrome DDT (WSD), D-TOX E motif/DDT domain
MPSRKINGKKVVWKMPENVIPVDMDARENVWVVRVTDEVHRIYSDYLSAVESYRQRQWICTRTGRTRLTFEEAKKSEEQSERLLESKFPQPAIRRIAEVVQASSMSRINELVDVVHVHLKKHFLVHEDGVLCALPEHFLTPAKPLDNGNRKHEEDVGAAVVVAKDKDDADKEKRDALNAQDDSNGKRKQSRYRRASMPRDNERFVCVVRAPAFEPRALAAAAAAAAAKLKKGSDVDPSSVMPANSMTSSGRVVKSCTPKDVVDDRVEEEKKEEENPSSSLSSSSSSPSLSSSSTSEPEYKSDALMYRVQWIDEASGECLEADVGGSRLRRTAVPFAKPLIRDMIRQIAFTERYIGAPWQVRDECVTEFKLPAIVLDATQLSKRAVFLARKQAEREKRARRESKRRRDDSGSELSSASSPSTGGGTQPSKRQRTRSNSAVVRRFPMDDLALEKLADLATPLALSAPLLPDNEFGLPSALFGDALMAWSFLRHYGTQLQLAPFPFAFFAEALLYVDDANPLTDEVIVALLRVLLWSVKDRSVPRSNLTASTYATHLFAWCKFRERKIRQHRIANALDDDSDDDNDNDDSKEKMRDDDDDDDDDDGSNEKEKENDDNDNDDDEDDNDEGNRVGNPYRPLMETLQVKYFNELELAQKIDLLRELCTDVINSHAHRQWIVEVAEEATEIRRVYLRVCKELKDKVKEISERSAALAKKEKAIRAREQMAAHEKDKLKADLAALLAPRLEPLGEDRYFNRYWYFDAIADAIFVEHSPDTVHAPAAGAQWGAYKHREPVETLLNSLNDKGVREKALREKLAGIFDEFAEAVEKRDGSAKASSSTTSSGDEAIDDDSDDEDHKEDDGDSSDGSDTDTDEDTPMVEVRRSSRLRSSSSTYAASTAPTETITLAPRRRRRRPRVEPTSSFEYVNYLFNA